MSEMARQTSLNRGRSITQRFRRFQKSMLRPFALASRGPLTQTPHSTNSGGGRNGYPYEATPVDGAFDNGYLNTNFGMTFTNFNGQTRTPNHNPTHHRDTSTASQLGHRAHASNRQPPEPSYLSRAMMSDAHGTVNPSHPKGDTLSLPFRLSISHLHSKTQRNVPYLRQSWTRIDFLAIVSFWITFGLATTGFEHGTGGLHIGLFRAISVIRIARLLSVTSGTTVSFPFFFLGGKVPVIDVLTDSLSFFKPSKTIMHSLKTARPLLASVAYFVVFAMVLFSYVFFSFSILLKIFHLIITSFSTHQ
jgi:voltage-dependent calcium channel